ncbi:MAG: hypothetical protein ACREB9_00860 [Thermoplasmata archaeon]
MGEEATDDLGKLVADFKAKVDAVHTALATRIVALEGEHAQMRAAFGDVVGEVERFGEKIDSAIADLKVVLGHATALQTEPAVPPGVTMSAATAAPPKAA